MSTQPQPDPGPHLRHSSHQQLPVRASCSSDNVLASSTMQDHRHPRRTAPEDSSSLRKQRQAPMDTEIPPQLPGADERESNKRRAAGGDTGGMFEQESSSREERSQPTLNEDSGEAGIPFLGPPPENPGNNAMFGWEMQLGPPGESAASGISDGASGEIDRESIADTEAHKSVSEDWFNTLNRDVGGNNYAALDDDPPYYLPNDYKKSNLGSITRCSRLNNIYQNRSLRAGMKRLHTAGSVVLIDSTEESNSDSFRSVIDDLTIKNQKLKKRLKKLEGLHGGNLAEEKLFEVRMHGLPSHKKQELEHLLQGFASSLDKYSSLPVPSLKKSPENLMVPSLPSANPSSTSLNNIADSAYVSNSRSGTNSVAQSSHVKTKSHIARSSLASDKISGGRVTSSSQTEWNKMKEVVRKLEQVFTGFKSKNAGSTPESTNSDRSGSNVGNVIPEEGAREALFMNPLQDKQAAELGGLLVVPQSDPRAIESHETSSQRATRPKDLDPKRLTKAEVNIEYLSNMTHSAETTKAGELGGGWFYLGLVINMAQIHTISVALSFIKKAIETTSEKLELSADGKMVRWRGGLEGTKLSSESSSVRGLDTSSITSDGSPGDSWDGMRKRSPGDSDSNAMSIDPLSKSGSRGRASSSSRRIQTLSLASTGNKFHYKPMFAQSGAFDDDTSSTLSSSMHSFPRRDSEEGDVPSVTRKSPLDGPIIYYEGGKFCTDLTTQVVKDGKCLSGFPYERFTNKPIGEKPSHVSSSPNTKRESPLFSRDTPPSIPSDNDSTKLDSDCDIGLQFSPRFSSSVPQTPQPPMELEASGIGGVLPDDNFAINVQKKHFLLPRGANGALPCSKKKLPRSRILRKILHQVPKSSIDVFQPNGLTEAGVSYDEESCTSGNEETSELDSGEERSAESGADDSEDLSSESSEPASNIAEAHRIFNHNKLIHPEFVSTHTLKLKPSSLPPANFIYFTPSDENSSVDMDSGADPQSSSTEDFFLHMKNQRSTDIYGNSGDDDDLSNGKIALNGMRYHQSAQTTTESGEASSATAATAGDASGCSTPAVISASEADMVLLPKVDTMNMDSSNWVDSRTSGDQLSSSAGDDKGSFGLADRSTLKRCRGSGTSASESAAGLVRKTPRKSEKAIVLDGLY